MHLCKWFFKGWQEPRESYWIMLNRISLVWGLKPCQFSGKCKVGSRCFLHPMCFTNIWDSSYFKEFSFKIYPCRALFVHEFCGFPPSLLSALSCLHFVASFFCHLFSSLFFSIDFLGWWYHMQALSFFLFILLPSVGFADLGKRKPIYYCEWMMWSKHVLE